MRRMPKSAKLAYLLGYKAATSRARDNLRALASKYDQELAHLNDDFQTMRLALSFNSPHFDEGQPDRRDLIRKRKKGRAGART